MVYEKKMLKTQTIKLSGQCRFKGPMKYAINETNQRANQLTKSS